jgi:heat shock protein HslJ
MMQGTWRVTYYSDHGQEETDHFTGYDFTFGADDLLSATDGSNTYTGAWTLSTNKPRMKPQRSARFQHRFCGTRRF